jgi:hypothetical protein
MPPNPRLLLYAALQQQQLCGSVSSRNSSSSNMLQRKVKGHGPFKYR